MPAGFRLHVALVAACAVIGAVASAASASAPADVVLRNGYVYTANAHNTVAQALAVRNGRVVFVGSNRKVRAFVGKHTKVTDLHGRMARHVGQLGRSSARHVERLNWSLQAGADLYQPLSNAARIDRVEARPSRFPGADVAQNAFIRVERQTLRKLAGSGDILFTIRIHLDPMPVLERHAGRAALAASFAAQLMALDTAQLDYKGLAADRDRLVARLTAMAAS